MKKFRPYTKFPDDIVGKVVKTHSDICVVTWLFGNYNKISIGTKTITPEDAFRECTFLDGTPVGEEYEEVVELEFDKVYLVRSNDKDEWVPRHFCKREGGNYLFFGFGMSSKTANPVDTFTWRQICEYSKDMAFTPNVPDATEYLIKQN